MHKTLIALLAIIMVVVPVGASTITTGTVTTSNITKTIGIHRATTNGAFEFTFEAPVKNRGGFQSVEVIGVRVASSAINTSDMTIVLNSGAGVAFDHAYMTVDLGTDTDQIVTPADRLILRADSSTSDTLNIHCTNTSATTIGVEVLYEILQW